MERTRWERFSDSFMAVIQLMGVVLVLVLVGKFLYDWTGTKDIIKTKLKNLKNKKWEKAPDDPKKPVIDEPLTDKEIDNELSKLNE